MMGLRVALCTVDLRCMIPGSKHKVMMHESGMFTELKWSQMISRAITSDSIALGHPILVQTAPCYG